MLQFTNDSVAQLGERMLDRHEVVGSSPIGIILKTLLSVMIEAFLFLPLFSLIEIADTPSYSDYSKPLISLPAFLLIQTVFFFIFIMWKIRRLNKTDTLQQLFYLQIPHTYIKEPTSKGRFSLNSRIIVLFNTF